MTEPTSASRCRPSKKAVGVFTLAAFLSYYTTGGSLCVLCGSAREYQKKFHFSQGIVTDVRNVSYHCTQKLNRRFGIVMVEFKFIEYGTDFGTRDMGQKLREKLLPLINGDEKVVLDFTGVNVVSNSFADECIAKLLLEMPLAELKRRTTFRGLNPLAERSVLVALQRRHKVITQGASVMGTGLHPLSGVDRQKKQ